MTEFEQYKKWVETIENKYGEYAFKSINVKFLDGTSFDEYYSAIFSSQDLFNKDRNKYRTPFQIERDRILYSPLFTRLLHKTQLFTAERIGFAESRLTHTLKVMQIGRSISRGLKLNEDLVEAITLGHDIGHPPFAHIGEQALDEWLEARLSPKTPQQHLPLIKPDKEILNKIEPKYQDKVNKYFLLGNDPTEKFFMHGRQSFRLLVLKRKAETREYLRFTRPVTYGIWRHSVNNLETDENFRFEKDIGEKRIILEGKSDLTLETQIVRYADDIAWVTSDLEEGINNKIFCRDIIPSIIDGIENSTLSARISSVFNQTPPKIIELYTIFISDIISTNFEKLKKLNGCQNPTTVKINFSDEINRLFTNFKRVIKENLHNKYFMARGSQVNKARIRALCDWYYNYPDDLLLEIKQMMSNPKFPIQLKAKDLKKDEKYSEYELYENLIRDDEIYRIANIVDFVSVLTDQEVYRLSETMPFDKD